MKIEPIEIMRYLVNKWGLREIIAAGLIGNIGQESGYDCEVVNHIGATGFFQELAERKDALLEFIDGDLTNWKGQIDFAMKELEDPFNGWDELSQATTVEEATEIFCRRFERPNVHEANIPRRIFFAKEAMEKWLAERK